MKKYLQILIAANVQLFVFSISVYAQEPVYVSSLVNNATPTRLEMTYNTTLANIIPDVSSFNVLVNSASTSVSVVAISGTKVLLFLPNPVIHGDVISVSYTIPGNNAIQVITGEQASSLASQNVTNNVIAVTPVYYDNDGNSYNAIGIGFQIWMKENLKTTKYNNGSSIPNITDNTTWAGLTSGAFCWYNNDALTYNDTYGVLYNWYAVNSTTNGGRNVCPTGWHVPADGEWTTLSNYLGGTINGGKLKETGTAHWSSPNAGATNETGFTALPGGYRGYAGSFELIGTESYWWSTTEYDASWAWPRFLNNGSTWIYNYDYPKSFGFSVRCIQNVQPIAEISGTTAVCLNAVSPVITFTGITGTAPFTFTYKINSGSNLTVSTSSGNSVTVSVPTGVVGTYTYSLVSIQDVYDTVPQSGNSIVTVNELPSANTTSATAVASSGAKLNGMVNANNTNTAVTFEYGLTPSYGSSIVAAPGVATGANNTIVSADVTGLIPNTTYHFRVVAASSGCITYGNDLTFTTPDKVTDADGNSYNTLIIGTQIWMQENLKTTKWGDGTPILNGLNSGDYHRDPAPKYYFSYNDDDNNIVNFGRYYTWYAATDIRNVCPTGWHVPTEAEWYVLKDYLITNGYGFGGGNQVGKSAASTSNWESDPTLGNVGNDQASNNITGFTGQPGGNRNCDYNNPLIKFFGIGKYARFQSANEYDTTEAFMGKLDANLSDLNIWGDSKKHAFNIRCMKGVISAIIYMPTLTTTTVSSLTSSSVISGGITATDGGGTITARGVCWSTSLTPTVDLPTKTTDGNGLGTFTSTITGLAPGTTYYVRAYATNSAGTGYGSQFKITTYRADAITDIEGNYYNIVSIGSQTWLAENLKTTRYSNGDLIGTTTNDISGEASPKYQWAYNDDESNVSIYGRLYTGYAIIDPRNVCPSGWHVPSDLEWTALTDYLTNNGYGYEGSGNDIAKSIADRLSWRHSNYAGNAGNDPASNNRSGFTGMASGYHNPNGHSYYVGEYGNWWSSTEYTSTYLYERGMHYDGSVVARSDMEKNNGLAVRCLSDYPKPNIVTNVSDNGLGSLRYAIEFANSNIGKKDTIKFNIQGAGPFTIQPLSPLPAITDPVVIDGFTQPGSSNNGSVLQIGIDGSKTGTGSNGLTLIAGNCTIKGLMIYQFTENGIQILNGSGNLISSNSIYSNGAIGINLGSDIVTLNDANDADSGPNNLQNFPVLDSVKFNLGAKTVFVHGSLESVPNNIFTLEFFTNKIGDNTGYGEGQTYLGSAQVTTDSNGKAVFGQTFAISSSWGDVISATATDSQGNTSEFSENVGGLQSQIIASDKWPFYFRTNVDGVLRITDGSDILAVDSSFVSWTKIPTANIDFRNGGSTTSKYASASDGMNLITFTDDQFPFSPGVLAIAAKTLKIVPGAADAQIIDADIVINPVFSRNDVGVGYNNPNAGTYDIQSIVTHEIGHVLGLLHSGIYNSTMFYMLGQGTKVRSLDQDDKSWASYRYPKAGYSSTYGSISGNIIYGYDNQPVAGALVLAINTSVRDTVHAYSDADGYYLVPGLRAGQYNIYIEPLDGSSKVYKLKPGNISSYIYCNTIYSDYPGEFYSINEGAVETNDNPVNLTVSAGHETGNIKLITNKDVTDPEILSVYPPRDTTNIDVTSDIIITFSEPVDKATLTDETCFLESGSKIHGVNYSTIGNNSSIILVALDSALKYSTSYNIHITTGVTDLRGNPLKSVYQSSFTTGSSDLTPPEITGTYPVDKADTVFVMDKVTVFFSEPMNKTSVENNFTLTWADGTPAVNKKVDGSFTWDKDNKSLTFTPLISLKEGTEYTITVSTAATDLSGNHLAAINLFKFTTVPTAAPVVVYLGPVNQADSVSVTTPVVADFSEPIDPSSVNSSTFNLKLNGVPVSAKFEFLNENSRVILRPDANLGFGKTYLVTLTAGIKDVSNPSLNMLGNKTGTFVTASQLTVPHISYLEPPAGTIGSDVIIAGTGFDPNPLNNSVKFNTTSAVVTGATLTSLTAKVPLGASSGPVTVAGKNAVQADNSMYFYVIPQSDNPCDVVVSNSSVGTKSTKDVAVDPNAAFAYVTNPLSDQVTVLDLVRSTVVKSISVGKTPMKIDINPSGSLAYVTNFNSNDVSVISLATNTVIRTIKVGIQPYGIAVTPNGKGVYVANYFSENVSLIDVDPYSGGFDHVVANVPTGTKTSNVAVSPDAGMVLVTGDFGLRIIDANPKDANYNCVVATASSGTKTKDVAVSPDAGLAIVSTEEGNLLVINLHPENGDYSDAVVANVPSGTNISNVKVSGDNMFVYASATDKNELLVYKITQGATGATNGSSVSAITLVPHSTISVGDAPEGLVIDAKAENIYIIDGPTASRQVTTIRLCCGPVDPAKAIGDLIMSVQNMISAGYISPANGKEIIDKLNIALSDLLKGNTKNAINDLNTFTNKVKAQINGHKISAAQGQPLINSVNIIITQLNGTKSALAEPYMTDDTEQAKQDLITESRLGVIYPNPFGESITINYEIAGNNEVPAEVHIMIYDINGLLTGTLVDEKMQTGRYSVSWNGRLENGNPAPFGTYFVLLRTGKVSEIRKVMFIK